MAKVTSATPSPPETSARISRRVGKTWPSASRVVKPRLAPGAGFTKAICSGADGAGSVARFYYPYGVAVDVSGNVYVADTDNWYPLQNSG